MKFYIFIFLFFLTCSSAFAKEQVEQKGLFTMDVPQGWTWAENHQEAIVAYPGTQTIAIDIQWSYNGNLSRQQMRGKLKESNDKMIQQGIEPHGGKVIDNKETSVDGVYATQLDFATSSPQSMTVSYIAFFHKGYAFSITYGARDENNLLVMDDMVASIKLK